VLRAFDLREDFRFARLQLRALDVVFGLHEIHVVHLVGDFVRSLGLHDLAIGSAHARALLDAVLLLLHGVKFNNDVTLFDGLAGLGKLDDAGIWYLGRSQNHRPCAADFTARPHADDELALAHTSHRHFHFRSSAVVVSSIAAAGAGSQHQRPDDNTTLAGTFC